MNEHQTSPYHHHYHHHHPTIYHVKTIDPNLNSTLNSTLPDACQTTGRNFNGNMNGNPNNGSLGNGLTNGLNLNINFTNNLCNSANQFILTNQLLMQHHQQLYQQQLANQNELNSLPVFVPQTEANNSTTTYQYATPVDQQFSFDEMSERQPNNFVYNAQQANQQVHHPKGQMNKLLVK